MTKNIGKEKCPTCNQERKLYQIFLDGRNRKTGAKRSLAGYGCKECIHEQIIKTYGKDESLFILGVHDPDASF